VGDEEYDMDEYVLRMEAIIHRNLEIYGDLKSRIGRIKNLMKEEDEAHANVRGTFYFWDNNIINNYKQMWFTL